MRTDRAAGRPGDAGWNAAGRWSLVIHTAIVGLVGVCVLGALLLAALAGVVTGTTQPSSSVPPAAVPVVPARAHVISAVVSGAAWQVRSVSTLRLLADGGELLGVRPSAREIFAVGPSGLIVITAPARCWR